MAETLNLDTIYLDNNATTPILTEVADAMRETALRFAANPASQHRAGQASRRALEEARERIAMLLGAKTTGIDADRLIFTSGGTEANNLALLGMLAAQRPAPHLITSAIEHPSMLGPAAELERRGWQVTRVAADKNGVVKFDEIAAAVRDETRLVSIMAANNETGVLQPLEEIGKLCADRNVLFHTDAAQWVGKLPTHFHEWQLAALSCAAHKFHGPLGIGALLVRGGVTLAPQLYGGHQQAAARPGTESLPLAVGMQAALECWHREAESRVSRLARLRDEFETQITAAIPTASVIGRHAPRLPNTSNIAFVGVDRQAFFLALDIAGVACSTGSACASGSSEPSPVLLAMGLPEGLVESALRLSFGALTTAADTQEASRRIIKAYNHLRR